jgi:hypothetical protein
MLFIHTLFGYDMSAPVFPKEPPLPPGLEKVHDCICYCKYSGYVYREHLVAEGAISERDIYGCSKKMDKCSMPKLIEHLEKMEKELLAVKNKVDHIRPYVPPLRF